MPSLDFSDNKLEPRRDQEQGVKEEVEGMEEQYEEEIEVEQIVWSRRKT